MAPNACLLFVRDIAPAAVKAGVRLMWKHQNAYKTYNCVLPSAVPTYSNSESPEGKTC